MDFTLLSVPTDWADFSDEAKAWILGVGVGIMIRLFRAALRWFNRVGSERHD